MVQIQSQIADDLASALSRTVPGFAPSSQKLAGRGETLRGRNPLYLIDGDPQHNAFRDGQRDGHSLVLAFVERIEVISGSNAIEGIGATGGVFNTVTPRAITLLYFQRPCRTMLYLAASGLRILCSVARSGARLRTLQRSRARAAPVVHLS